MARLPLPVPPPPRSCSLLTPRWPPPSPSVSVARCPPRRLPGRFPRSSPPPVPGFLAEQWTEFILWGGVVPRHALPANELPTAQFQQTLQLLGQSLSLLLQSVIYTICYSPDKNGVKKAMGKFLFRKKFLMRKFNFSPKMMVICPICDEKFSTKTHNSNFKTNSPNGTDNKVDHMASLFPLCEI